MIRTINVTLVAIALAASTGGVLLTPTAAHAQATIDQRCGGDSLAPNEAVWRLEWARRCGTQRNIMSPANPDSNRRIPTGEVDVNGVELIEYSETSDFNGANSYCGNNNAYVNTKNVFYQFTAFPAGRTTHTDVNGFQYWTRPTLLARPQYPTFSTYFDISSTLSKPLWPHPNVRLFGDFSDCRLFTDQNGTQPYAGTFYVNVYCTSSCYTPEQTVSFVTGDEKIVDAVTVLRPTGLTTVAPGSTLEKIRFTTDDVASYTKEVRDVTNVIFEIRTASGGELRVTDKHPVIQGSGRVVEAASLKVGDKLIKADGSRDRIVSINKTTHFGQVYNIKPKSLNRVANILVAQGFLVGSSRYQNEDADYINRILLGRVPVDVIPK